MNRQEVVLCISTQQLRLNCLLAVFVKKQRLDVKQSMNFIEARWGWNEVINCAEDESIFQEHRG